MKTVQVDVSDKEDPEYKLLPLLNSIQKEKGYISKDDLSKAAERSNVPLAKAYGITKFFEDFDLSPKGKYKIQVCDGTACHVRGSMKILDRISRELDIEEGETTDDELFTLTTVRCLGCCSLAPVTKIGDEIYGDLTADKAIQIIKDIREGEEDESD